MEEEAARSKYSRRSLVLLVTPIAILGVVGTLTTAFTPKLAVDHPLLLITLEARNRNLILARSVDLLPFILIATLRRILTDPLYFILGRRYGDAAIRWLEKKAGLGPTVNVIEKVFPKASHVLVFLFPGAIVCALAGATGMSPVIFMVLNVAGTITAVLVVRRFSDAVADPVEDLLGFFERNMLETTIVTIALVVLSVLLGRIQETPDAAVDELEDEIRKTGPGDAGDERPGSPEQA